MEPSTLLLGLIFSYSEPGVGGGEDYSAQWAEYYRSIGKVKEAEAIEAQMRLVLNHLEKINKTQKHCNICTYFNKKNNELLNK